MTRITALIVVLFVAALAALAPGQDPQPALPPGHPPMLPAGHPEVAPDGTPAPAPAPAAARPEDVATAEAVVAAYYDAISGPAGTDRDWGRFQSLFLPGARLVSTTGGDGGGSPIVITPEIFSRMNSKYFQSSGYRERSVRERRQAFGHVEHIWSTYEAYRGDEDKPYSRGVNSFQLLLSEGRWWIIAVAWDRERPGASLPPEHLPPASGDSS